MNHLVTVIIPTYNSAQFISEAIESVLNQTYRNFEIVVVDDGSMDNTRRILEPFSKKIKYIYQENSGPSKARNTGIQNSKGEYIAFLDADDTWLSEKLELQVKIISNNMHLGLIFTDSLTIENEKLGEKTFLNQKKCYEDLLKTKNCIHRPFKILFNENFVVTSTVMVRKKCFDRVGRFDESFSSAEDRELWLRLSAYYDFALIPRVLIHKRNHSNNIGFDWERCFTSRIKVFRKIISLHPEIIKKEKIDVPSKFIKLYNTLGYFYFERNDFIKAKENYLLSLAHSPNIKAMLYWSSTFLGENFIQLIRKLKKAVL